MFAQKGFLAKACGGDSAFESEGDTQKKTWVTNIGQDAVQQSLKLERGLSS